MNTHVPPGDNGIKLMNAGILRTYETRRDVPPATFSARERPRLLYPPPLFQIIIFPFSSFSNKRFRHTSTSHDKSGCHEICDFTIVLPLLFVNRYVR